MKKIFIIFIALVVLFGMVGETYAVSKVMSKDLISPVITKTYPIKDSMDIMIEGPILVRFNENVVVGTAFSQISLKDEFGTSQIFTATIDKKILKIVPKNSLVYSTVYTLSIPIAAVKDLAGNALEDNYVLDFGTEENPSNTDNIGGLREISLNYDILLNADIAGGITEEKVAAIIQRLRAIGINSEILSIQGTSVGEIIIEEDTDLDNHCQGYDVILEDCGPNKIQVIRVIREFIGVSLIEAKRLAEATPSYIERNISKYDAEFMKLKLEEQGATISVVCFEETELGI